MKQGKIKSTLRKLETRKKKNDSEKETEAQLDVLSLAVFKEKWYTTRSFSFSFFLFFIPILRVFGSMSFWELTGIIDEMKKEFGEWVWVKNFEFELKIFVKFSKKIKTFSEKNKNYF